MNSMFRSPSGTERTAWLERAERGRFGGFPCETQGSMRPGLTRQADHERRRSRRMDPPCHVWPAALELIGRLTYAPRGAETQTGNSSRDAFAEKRRFRPRNGYRSAMEPGAALCLFRHAFRLGPPIATNGVRHEETDSRSALHSPHRGSRLLPSDPNERRLSGCCRPLPRCPDHGWVLAATN